MALSWEPISTLSKVTRPWEVNFCRQMAIKTPLESSALPLLESGRKRTVKRVQNRSSGPSFMYYLPDKVYFGILAESWTSLAPRTIRIRNTHEDKREQDSKSFRSSRREIDQRSKKRRNRAEWTAHAFSFERLRRVIRTLKESIFSRSGRHIRGDWPHDRSL